MEFIILAMFNVLITETIGSPGQRQTAQHNTTMKNVKLEIRKLSKAGFSLVEMLVVIAVIGIIAAIAIPNIGNVNKSAKDATARRNAQSLASVASAAIAAGWTFTADDAEGVYDALKTGVKPTTGAFSGRQFIVPNLPTNDIDKDAILEYLEWDSTNNVLLYKSDFTQ